MGNERTVVRLTDDELREAAIACAEYASEIRRRTRRRNIAGERYAGYRAEQRQRAAKIDALAARFADAYLTP